jgi:hypothetical protein
LQPSRATLSETVFDSPCQIIHEINQEIH